MGKTTWTKEMWRAKRARQRAERLARGEVRAVERRHKCDVEDIPEEVYARGAILAAMMRSHPSQWKPEWTADL